MKVIQSNIPLAFGDLINIKTFLDDVKNEHDQINLTFHQPLFNIGVNTGTPDWAEKKKKWDKYLNDIGKLFFSEPPYTINLNQYPFLDAQDLVKKFRLKPRKPELSHLLCDGKSLDIGEYIVITTKIREAPRNLLYPLFIELWGTLRQLSKKYKIVVLGERTVEMRKEYIGHSNTIFGIYEQIIANIPSDCIIDLTVPALGETVSDLTQIRQDCLIMNEAELVVTLGVGGNFCMATAVSNMVGFRADNLWLADLVFTQEYPDCIVTKDWSRFISELEKYL